MFHYKYKLVYLTENRTLVFHLPNTKQDTVFSLDVTTVVLSGRSVFDDVTSVLSVVSTEEFIVARSSGVEAKCGEVASTLLREVFCGELCVVLRRRPMLLAMESGK